MMDYITRDEFAKQLGVSGRVFSKLEEDGQLLSPDAHAGDQPLWSLSSVRVVVAAQASRKLSAGMALKYLTADEASAIDLLWTSDSIHTAASMADQIAKEAKRVSRELRTSESPQDAAATLPDRVDYLRILVEDLGAYARRTQDAAGRGNAHQ